MARYPTFAQNFGQGMQVGGALGSAWSDMRFRRGEGKLQEEFAARAEAEGKPLDAYAGEYEQALDRLYRKSGAAKRGVTGDSGSAINVDAYNRYQTSLGRVIDRDAAQKLVGGDVQGGYGRRAEGAANRGDFEAARTNAIGRDTVGATTAAIIGDDDKTGRAGQVDPYALQQGIATTNARHGDASGALSAQQGAEGARYEVASALTGQIIPLLNDPAANADRIRGLFEGLKQYIPLAQDMDIAFDDAGVLNIYQNGKAIGSLDDPEEAMGILRTLERDPRGALAGWEQSRITAAAAKGEHDRDSQKRFEEHVADMAKEYAKGGGKASDMTSLGSTLKQASADGWKNFETHEDGTITAVDPTGNLVTITQGRDSGVPGGERLAGFTITDGSGRVIDPGELNAGAALEHAQNIQLKLSQAQGVQDYNRLIQGVEMLNTIFTGGPSAFTQGRLNSAAGGQSFPYKETDDYVRKIMGKVGQVSGSPREQAKQLMSALVQQESGGDHGAVSAKGARGLTQIMPATEGDPGYGVKPLQNRSKEEALRFGEDYLTAMINEFGSPELGLAAYNAGPGTVKEWLASGKVGMPSPQQGVPNRQVAQATAAPAAQPASGVPATAAPAAPALPPRKAEGPTVAEAKARLEAFTKANPGTRRATDRGSSWMAPYASDSPEGIVHKRLTADLEAAKKTATSQKRRDTALRGIELRQSNKDKAEALYTQYSSGDTAGAAPDPQFDDMISQRLGSGSIR